MTQPSTIILRLVEITQRKGRRISARDVATATLAIAALRHLDDSAKDNLRAYGDALSTSIDRGIKLNAMRELLEQIKEILE